MPLNPQIPLQGQGVQMPNFLGMMAQAEQTRGARQNREMKAKQAKLIDDEAVKADKKNKTFSDLYLKSKGDFGLIAQGLASAGYGDEAVKTSLQGVLQKKQKTEQDKLMLDLEDKVLKQALPLALKMTPEARQGFLMENYSRSGLDPSEIEQVGPIDDELYQNLLQSHGGGSGGKYGLTPVYGTNAQGERVPMRMGPGGLESLPLPEGVTGIASGFEKIDLGDRIEFYDKDGNYIGSKSKGTSPSDSPELKGKQESAKIEARGQIPLTAFEEAVDKKFAPDYTDWVTGGRSSAQKGISQLKEVASALNSKNLTGPAIGMIPDFVKKFSLPESIDARDLVEEVVQRNLRLVLGAQFTENEGNRLIARAYNQNLKPEVNAKRLKRLLTQMESALKSKDAAVKYVENNGTLKGFKGKLVTSQEDFDLDGESAPTGWTPEKQKRLEELRRKQAEGTIK